MFSDVFLIDFNNTLITIPKFNQAKKFPLSTQDYFEQFKPFADISIERILSHLQQYFHSPEQEFPVLVLGSVCLFCQLTNFPKHYREFCSGLTVLHYLDLSQRTC